MIEDILPGVVSAVETFTDPPGATLFPEEEAVMAAAVTRRRQEFATVRCCARAALARLGYPPAPILPGPRRAPVWPAGVVGSMTHCDGYRAAAVARDTDVYAIGIDAEPHQPLPGGVLTAVTGDGERAMIQDLAGTGTGTHWDRLIFSAKESVYKAWFPLAGRWLGFEQAEVTPDPAGGFSARLLVPGPVSGFDGRWLVRDGLLLTAIVRQR